MQKQVRKAVIAAAGFGTRFLPQTKAMPKEMLPLVDKPIIQYIVEDLVEAGVCDIIIVTGYSKRSIEDHFDTPNEDLLNNLRAGGASKVKYIEQVNAIADMANFAYVRQKGPYGTATPVMNAAPLIGSEPFFYIYADDFTVAKPNPFIQSVQMYEKYNAPILPCIKVNTDADYDRYGIVAGEAVEKGVVKVSSIVEKPGKDNAPSDYASVGGMLLTPDIFNYLEAGKKSLKKGQEFYLTDRILHPMMRDGKEFYGYVTKNSVRYDTGNPLDYLIAVMDFALDRKDIGPKLKEHLRNKLG